MSTDSINPVTVVPFERRVSQSSWTMPAFASILTGKYPRQHGALSLTGRLKKENLTLAEILKEHGYNTAAVISHVYVGDKLGFSQGFEIFNEDNLFILLKLPIISPPTGIILCFLGKGNF